MAQLSRPYQIALAVSVFLALVWFVVLRPHSASSEAAPVGSAPVSAPASAPSSAAVPVKHDVTKASHRAAGIGKPSVGKHHAASSTQKALHKHAAHVLLPHKLVAPGIPPRQAAVEGELKRGEVAVVLFWNKHGADDVLVHRELQVLTRLHRLASTHATLPAVARVLKLSEVELNKPIAVHYATTAQVASFGSITRGVPVYGTPTILIVNKQGQTTTLTGFEDYYSIEQTIDEARQAQS